MSKGSSGNDSLTDPKPWEQPLGARPLSGDDDLTQFRVWAPRAERIVLSLRGSEHELSAAGYGVYETTVEARGGDDYVYLVDGEALPDPCSRWQPQGL